ncbi:MAG: TolC family protein [Phycisphaeraceae bacterium]|nr:MAG: TolC family protein [Phycisphaeraceae bacterium]
MNTRFAACAAGAAWVGVVGGCSSPLDAPHNELRSIVPITPDETGVHPTSAFRDEAGDDVAVPELSASSTPDDYVRYALYHSPAVEAAYQKWVAAAERVPQLRALPDPRLNVGFFADEVETRTGPQKARLGVSQSFPWPGLLARREDAAVFAARAEWLGFEAARLAVTERLVGALHELAYVDEATRITRENLDLLRSFEGVIRARYRVGEGSHAELTRVQVELGQLEDRLAQLHGMRPAYVAELNAALNRPTNAEIASIGALPGRVAAAGGTELAELARSSNPRLLALDEHVEEQRSKSDAARLEGLPDFTIGVDYIVTGEAMNRSIPESGDDPILLSFGLRVPLWREKYDAAVRESTAMRLAVSRERQDEANRIDAEIQRAWFEHTDADRRVRLYRQTLIPKAEESLNASLAGYRTGETSFLELLDTQRALLEFALEAARAKADRGEALARLNRLVGQPVPTAPVADGEGKVTP